MSSISESPVAVVGILITVINVLWGIVFIMAVGFIKKMMRNVDELNSATSTLAKGVAVLDNKIDDAKKRMEVVASRVHDMSQDLGFVKGVLSGNHGD